jgi:hypothetical protein
MNINDKEYNEGLKTKLSIEYDGNIYNIDDCFSMQYPHNNKYINIYTKDRTYFSNKIQYEKFGCYYKGLIEKNWIKEISIDEHSQYYKFNYKYKTYQHTNNNDHVVYINNFSEYNPTFNFKVYFRINQFPSCCGSTIIHNIQIRDIDFFKNNLSEIIEANFDTTNILCTLTKLSQQKIIGIFTDFGFKIVDEFNNANTHSDILILSYNRKLL